MGYIKPPGKGAAIALPILLVNLTLITYYTYNRPVNIEILGKTSYEELANCIVGNGRERISGWE